MAPIVIVGSGLAGYTLVREIRKLDPAVEVVLVTRDDGAVYSKPVLSNALAGKRDPAAIPSADAACFAAQSGLSIRSFTEVTAIDVEAGLLRVQPVQSLAGTSDAVASASTSIPYSALVLALGADPIRPALAGDAAGLVLSVNDLADYGRFRAALVDARHVTLLGAGLIGCEFANDLVLAGYAVDVVDPAPQPLGRLLPPGVAEVLRARLEAAGVRFRFGTVAEAVEEVGKEAVVEGGAGSGDARRALRRRVRLANGDVVETDVVLSAIGLAPRTGLARSAGLRTQRGIVVDRRLATSDPRIFAMGDCVELDGMVLPYVMPLMQQAKALAATLTGHPTEVRYPAMPVSVKTPAAPTVVAPPPPGAVGSWQVEGREGGVEASFVAPDGTLLGFALLGSATASRLAFTKRLVIA
jgi:rubredoxin---NAD+ reductase